MLRRSPLVLAVILAVVFLGGGAVGLGLAGHFAPNSHAAAFVSFFALPLALVAGFQAWLGLAIIILLPGFFIRLLTGAPAVSTPISSREFVPPGSAVFVPIASSFGLGAGLIVGFLSDAYTVWIVTFAYWLVGSAYGLLVWLLARSGYVPFSDSG
ncbi:MAG TPA: hypothetical protein VJQ55_06750 [Candidatus Binatia bacterium]|nr:hypothetical protein [Candidatus Binatia bacterium]